MNIVAMVLAGGEGTRLYPLTAEHAKPALPFANGYRIVDFVLSNLVNSRISTIYVLAQYKPESLIQHIAAAWAPWFADGEGTIKVLLPRSNTLGGQFKGTADAVYQYLDLLQAHSPDLVAVFAADHVYRMDVRQMVALPPRARAPTSPCRRSACRSRRRRRFGIVPTGAGRPRARVPREAAARRRRCPATRRAPTPRWATTCSIPSVLEQRAARGAPPRRHRFRPRHPAAPVRRRGASTPTTSPTTACPGVQDYEERGLLARRRHARPRSPPRSRTRWAAAPRFNLWNRRWPIRGEYDAALLAKLRDWREQAPPKPLRAELRPRRLASRE